MATRIATFYEKPQDGEGWINGGYFLLNRRVLDYIDGDDAVWERDPIEQIAQGGELMGYQHYGFWSCMDTLKEKNMLEELWEQWQIALEDLVARREESTRRLAHMRVLVTGTDGYIGVVLAPFLLQRGYDVVGLDTGFYRDAWLYNNGVCTLPPVKNKDLRCMTVDDVAGMDAVVHLAELSNDPLGQLSPHITYAINHQGSVALAQLCKVAGVPRFVYTSSCSVYGIGGGE